MKLKRVGIVQIHQESNDLNPVHTTRADFESFQMAYGADGLKKFSEGEEVGGFVQALGEWVEPAEPVGLLMAQAWSGGPLQRDTREWLLRETQHQLSRAGTLDAVLFSLHGAMTAEDEVDVDGLFLQAVRQAVGPSVPVVATLDLHANLTPRMLEQSDVLLAYHTQPHLDRFKTGRRAGGVLEQLMSGARPSVGYTQLPMNNTGAGATTEGPVLAPVFERVRQLESQSEVLSTAVLMSQPWLDVPGLGWSTMVATDNQPELAQALSEQLAQMCWDRREELVDTEQLYGPRDCVERALAHPGQPVVIADGADATNSGAPGDSVHLLKEMIGRSIPDGALTIMVDPEAVSHARKVGPSAPFELAVGGKRDHVNSRPLPVKGTVLFVRPAQYILSGHLGDKLPINMGMSAAVKVGDVTLLLVEKVGPGSSPEMYRCVGLEPKDFKIVIVKSPAGFRADFGSIAAEILLSDCPGCAPARIEQVPYTRITRPVWPLDPIDDWRDIDWCAARAKTVVDLKVPDHDA